MTRRAPWVVFFFFVSEFSSIFVSKNLVGAQLKTRTISGKKRKDEFANVLSLPNNVTNWNIQSCLLAYQLTFAKRKSLYISGEFESVQQIARDSSATFRMIT